MYWQELSELNPYHAFVLLILARIIRNHLQYSMSEVPKSVCTYIMFLLLYTECKLKYWKERMHVNDSWLLTLLHVLCTEAEDGIYHQSWLSICNNSHLYFYHLFNKLSINWKEKQKYASFTKSLEISLLFLKRKWSENTIQYSTVWL